MTPLYHYLPFLIKKQIIRRAIPDLSRKLDFIIKETPRNDINICLSIAHDQYVNVGYMKKEVSGIRKVKQHDSNETVVFSIINTLKKDIIGTVTLFSSSFNNNLPSDDGFSKQLNSLRNKRRKIVEVGCLAIKQEYKKEHKHLLYLINKTLILYSINHLKANDLIITTHPKNEDVYKAILLFKKIGYLRKFLYAENNPAVLLRMDLNTLRERLYNSYKNYKKERNVFEFIFNNV